ncbi:MAG: hypothetical protein WC465_03090 [Patescibacteria group bacterium]
MFRINGFGTTLLGKTKVDKSDNSYVATEWVTALFFPVVPIRAYRVIRTERSKSFWTGGFPEYQMTPVVLDRKQIVKTYLVWWLPVIVIITIIVALG